MRKGGDMAGAQSVHTAGECLRRGQLTTMDMERVWSTVARRPLFWLRSDKRGTGARPVVDDVVALCLLVLLAVTVLGGLLALFHWVAAMLPVSAHVPCLGVDGCVSPAADESQAVWEVDPRLDGPRMVP
jgi:hypothetical protein